MIHTIQMEWLLFCYVPKLNLSLKTVQNSSRVSNMPAVHSSLESSRLSFPCEKNDRKKIPTVEVKWQNCLRKLYLLLHLEWIFWRRILFYFFFKFHKEYMCFAEDHLQYCLWNHNKESRSVLCFLSMAEGGTIPTEQPFQSFLPHCPTSK